ncbi:MAG: transcriptional regulator, TetR family [Conexibacter sp.]|jgi:AcrR family transcriptional regulator|nr:transcriptional regulator, TetR family [Conexibacter sp.]
MAVPPTRPALRERYDRKQRSVIAVAAELFAERGYQRTSVGDLTEATGLAAGGLYHYIGSKEQLLISICDALMDPLLEQAQAIVSAEAPPEVQLRELVRAWVAHVEAHRPHMLVFQQERQTIEREPQWRRVRSKRKAFERLLEQLLERGEQAGTLRFADRQLALLGLLAMVNYMPQWYRPGGRLSAQQVADGYCDLLLETHRA